LTDGGVSQDIGQQGYDNVQSDLTVAFEAWQEQGKGAREGPLSIFGYRPLVGAYHGPSGPL